jgi:hypothetical protein
MDGRVALVTGAGSGIGTGGFGSGTLQADGSVKAEPVMDVRPTTMPSFVGRG